MYKKFLLATCVISAMGVFSLFAEEDSTVKPNGCTACACFASEEETTTNSCVLCKCDGSEEEIKTSLSSEEEITTRAVCCGACGGDHKNSEEIEESMTETEPKKAMV